MRAKEIFLKNFRNEMWFGKCIFLSWYCEKGSCKFCYRSVNRSEKTSRRSLASVLVEAFLCKKFKWKLEFLTGGYGIYDFDELVDIVKKVKEVYGEKIWLNLGVLNKEEIERFKPYIKGIVASIETVNEKLHKEICPKKPIEPYEDMLRNCSLKKSITIIIGLGENEGDKEELFKFIEKHKLDRITFYALKPIEGTIFKKGPESKYYASWIRDTRIRFPELEIIAGITPRRVDDVCLLLDAGANAITKFPITKEFNTEKSRKFEEEVKKSGRKLLSKLNGQVKIDFKEIDGFSFDKKLKEEMKEKLGFYLKRMKVQ